MEWFEEYYGDVALKIKIKKIIADFHSKYQHIQLFDTFEFGKMLVLDGKIQLTEKDEAFYHEMLVHVPMFTHRNPEKVLIIGGGDGGSLREVLKHDVSEAVLVELDGDVVELSKKHLGIDNGAFEDPRATVLIEDGIEFVKNLGERFDVIIVDGTDPNPYSEHIMSREFYEACSKIADVFATQSQSPFVQPDYFKKMFLNISGVMDVRVYLNFVPTYPLGLWSYLIHADEYPSLEDIEKRFSDRGIRTEHYNPEVHAASFALPEWVRRIVVDG
ncbi:polyamine aminopropyltransferase [Geoglobus acetivorans]|uniref:Polyamine aminopropyltransferase n=1 Tax=Geoglobus acetivorans TaxID=565033 RepID=A0A0A7GJS8_GEOAI|nr:Spermidine synthase [Geoglobus acetivorans]